MLKKTTTWVVLIYGLLLMTLGYIGYSSAGSYASLYSGMSFGALLILSSLLMFRGIRWSSYVALALSIFLTVLFSVRYSITGRTIPAILAVLSGGVLLFLLAQTTKWKR